MVYETIVLILAFLIVWTGHAVYSFVLNLGRTSYFVNTLDTHPCVLPDNLRAVIEFLELKYSSLKQMGVQKNEIKVLRNEDEHQSSDATNACQHDNENYPKPFTSIDFNNWNQMIISNMEERC